MQERQHVAEGCRGERPVVTSHHAGMTWPHPDLCTHIQCFGHGHVNWNPNQTRAHEHFWQKPWRVFRCEGFTAAEHRCLLGMCFVSHCGLVQQFPQYPHWLTVNQSSQVRCDTHTHTGKTGTQEGTAGNRWKSQGGGSVFSVLVCICVCLWREGCL